MNYTSSTTFLQKIDFVFQTHRLCNNIFPITDQIFTDPDKVFASGNKT